MRYEEPVYRPPSEAASLLIQATIGCPHNKCTFCGMYKGKRFRIRRVSEIKKDLDMAREFYGTDVRTLFLPDGNTIFMKTKDLIEILQYAGKLFPKLTRITVYGSAKFLNLKSVDDFKSLREAGLSRIHAGIETGDDVLLSKLKKGATAEQMIEAGRKVKAAGIELSEYILVGIGGRERT
ncbi:MAG: radical SAM protein, partial [Planctomycetota bacterium]